MDLMSVVLPEPLGPISAYDLPASKAMFMLSMAMRYENILD
jgi:hypothetical protein